MLTLDQCRKSSVSDVANVGVNTPAFSDIINEVTQRLMQRGDWVGTLTPIVLCTYAGCVVWPRYVGNIRAINVCGKLVPVHNQWFDFLESKRNGAWLGLRGARCNMIQQPRVCTFSDIWGEGRTIRLYHQAAADIGKTVQIFGVDNNGQPLQTSSANGTVIVDGITLTMQLPYAETPTFVRRIDRVIKDETLMGVSLFAWNAAQSQLEPVATYDASETDPSYAKSNLHLPCGLNGGNMTTKPVVALVKLEFIPVKAGTDIVLINNVGALKLGTMALKYENSGEIDTAEKYWNRAVAEMNFQLKDAIPDEQIPADVGPLCGTGVGFQKCF